MSLPGDDIDDNVGIVTHPGYISATQLETARAIAMAVVVTITVMATGVEMWVVTTMKKRLTHGRAPTCIRMTLLNKRRDFRRSGLGGLDHYAKEDEPWEEVLVSSWLFRTQLTGRNVRVDGRANTID